MIIISSSFSSSSFKGWKLWKKKLSCCSPAQNITCSVITGSFDSGANEMSCLPYKGEETQSQSVERTLSTPLKQKHSTLSLSYLIYFSCFALILQSRASFPCLCSYLLLSCLCTADGIILAVRYHTRSTSTVARSWVTNTFFWTQTEQGCFLLQKKRRKWRSWQVVSL